MLFVFLSYTSDFIHPPVFEKGEIYSRFLTPLPFQPLSLL